MFRSGTKLETFYNLLVKEIKETEHGNPGDVNLFVENRKDVVEISQTFLRKSSFYRSYVTRTIAETILGILMLVWLCLFGLDEVMEVHSLKSSGNYRVVLDRD